MSEILWTAEDAARATGGRAAGLWSATGVSIDTRTLQPGDLFVALKDKRDGHAFAADALAKGAAAALVSDETACEGPRLIVDDTQRALGALGAAARDRSSAIRTGVTGSVGKTSVKAALAAIFAAAGPAHASAASYNNHWGVPLTLARMPAASERAVFEMGMNAAGEIRALTRQVRPHIALIIKIAPAHLEQLGSLEAIADAKSEIYEGLTPDGVAILPADDDFAERLAAAARRSKACFLLDFGVKSGAAVRILAYADGPEGGAGRLDVLGRTVPIRLSAPGAHHIHNAAAAMATAVAAGIDPERAAEILSRQGVAAGRGRIADAPIPGGTVRVIDDSYNANPASMAAAIAGLAQQAPAPGGRRIAVIGEMLELGAEAADHHAALALQLVEAGAGLVIGVGPLTKALLDALPEGIGARYAADANAALAVVNEALRPGDVILIKGSNASGVHRAAARLLAPETVVPTGA